MHRAIIVSASLLAAAVGQAFGQVVTFAPGTDEAYIEEVHNHIYLRQLELRRIYGDERFVIENPRWADGGADGDPITITWSIVPDTPAIAGCDTGLPGGQAVATEPEAPNRIFQRLNFIFAGQTDAWVQVVADAFDSTVFNAWGSLSNNSGITFQQVTRPAIPDPNNPGEDLTFFWDDGPMLIPNSDPPECFNTIGTESMWGDPGVIEDGGINPDAANRGDIRIAMKQIDGPGRITAYAYPPNHPMFPGEIVLDVDELWDNDSFFFRQLRNAVARQVGVALGLGYVCIEPPFDALMEPILLEGNDGPQLDDIRGINYLYGDYLEDNDLRDIDSAVQLNFDPVQALLGESFSFPNLSINPDEEDVFYVVIPEFDEVDVDVTIVMQPGEINTPFEQNGYKAVAAQGDPLPFTESCAGVVFPDPIQVGRLYDFKIGVFNSDDVPVDDVTDVGGSLIILDPNGFVNNTTALGGSEAAIWNISEPGTYFLVIAADGDSTPGPDMYDLSIRIGNEIFSDGVTWDAAISQPAPFGIGAAPLNNFPPGSVPEGEPVFTGFTTTFGLLDSQHPSLGHDSTRFKDGTEVPPVEQMFPPMRVNWPGGATSAAAIGGPAVHPTIVAAAGAGNPAGTQLAGHLGPSFEASLASASISTRLLGGGIAGGLDFLTQQEAIAFALWALTDPTVAAQAGLPAPSDVVCNAWGIQGDHRGDSPTTRLFEAAVFMKRRVVVAAAGNSGLTDNTDTCGGAGGDSFGGPYFGGKTLSYPATGFNVLTVGSAARELDPETPFDPNFVDASAVPFTIVTGTSSKGPIDAFDFELGATQFQSRAGIDLLGPGGGFVSVAENPQDLEPPAPPCSYPGHQQVIFPTGPEFSTADDDLDDPDNPERFGPVAGTSLAAGAVAGGINLLCEFGNSQDPPFSTDPALMRALVMTTASQLRGWSDNGLPAMPQDNRDGRDEFDIITQLGGQQTVDYAQGAGMLDLTRAYEIYRGNYLSALGQSLVPIPEGAETTDVPETDPNVPTVTVPPNELELIFPAILGNRPSRLADDPDSPFTPADLSGPASVDELPPSPLDIALKLRKAMGDTPRNAVARGYADTGDPDLDTVDGEKSASGVTITPRPPFILPDDPDIPIPSLVIPPRPTELTGAIPVQPIGWDMGMLGVDTFSMPEIDSAGFDGGPLRTGYIDYFIQFPFSGADSFQACVSWLRRVVIEEPDFSDVDNPQIGELTELELENVDIFLIQTDATGVIVDDHILLGAVNDGMSPIVDAGQSIYETMELIRTTPSEGFYTIRVQWQGQVYDLFNNQPDASIQYALTWRTAPFPLFGPQTAAPAMNQGYTGGRHLFTVFNNFLDAFGSSEGDASYNVAYDIDRNGAVDVMDFWPVVSFWMDK